MCRHIPSPTAVIVHAWRGNAIDPAAYFGIFTLANLKLAGAPPFCSRREERDISRPMFRFTIRDALMFTALVGVCVAWLLDRDKIRREREQLVRRPLSEKCQRTGGTGRTIP